MFNAVIIAVALLFILAIFRVHIVLAMVLSAVAGGLIGGLGINKTIATFAEGLGAGAEIALSYALLGAFAVALSKTGLPDALAHALIKRSKGSADAASVKKLKGFIVFAILLLAISSQNVLPIHIAFIPIIIPPLLGLFNEMKIDRRLIAIVMTFGLVTPYMFLPVGFGDIYLNQILLPNISKNGMDTAGASVIQAMAIPALGMLVGLLIGLYIYRKPREYEMRNIAPDDYEIPVITKTKLFLSALVVLATLAVQLTTESMIFAATTGLVLFLVLRLVRFSEADDVITRGMRMMSFIGFVMISANGFSNVLRKTGDIDPLVENSKALMGDSQLVAAFVMLLIGLLVTMGIGSSFSTVPVIAAIFVPLCVQYGFSLEATIAIIGTAGALGDAGSPASDSTLGPTSGLNADGQHDHMRETVIPTFLHYNLPLIIFGTIAAVVL
ncbi:MAG TPA: sodium:proton antiporter [Exiguobacterium sp.]|uniref:Na+/H+ antiporter family protein n=1 Tax=Exiguobacterium sp. TaxID=44751 RepID=UPI000EBE0B68|nr:Na+/H+ antiporter NhaC family protein [Exiguobacterium sp.]HCN59247.1 sodium:proton antiporter [Exiguobacterium sp.]